MIIDIIVFDKSKISVTKKYRYPYREYLYQEFNAAKLYFKFITYVEQPFVYNLDPDNFFAY